MSGYYGDDWFRDLMCRLWENFSDRNLAVNKLQHWWEFVQETGATEAEVRRAFKKLMADSEITKFPTWAQFARLLPRRDEDDRPSFTGLLWGVDGSWSGNIGLLQGEKAEQVALYVKRWFDPCHRDAMAQIEFVQHLHLGIAQQMADAFNEQMVAAS